MPDAPPATPEAAPAAPVTAPTAPPTAAPSTPAATPPVEPPTQAPPTGAAPTAPPPGPEGAWVPSGRLRETRDQVMRQAAAYVQQQLKEQNTALETARRELDQTKTQLHSLVGVSPPEAPEVAQAKEQLTQWFPQLAKLTDENLERLLKLPDQLSIFEKQAQATKAQQEHYWNDYSTRALTRLHGLAEKQFGGPLSPEQKQFVESSFYGYMHSNPQAVNRLSQDLNVVNEYWDKTVSPVFGPQQRAAAAAVQQATTAPAGPVDAPSGAVPTTPAPKPKSADEMARSSWLAYQQHGTG